MTRKAKVKIAGTLNEPNKERNFVNKLFDVIAISHLSYRPSHRSDFPGQHVRSRVQLLIRSSILIIAAFGFRKSDAAYLVLEWSCHSSALLQEVGVFHQQL